MRGKRAYLSTWSLALTTRNRPHHPNANPSRSNHRACSGDDVRIDSSPRPPRKTYLLLASIDNMLISLVRCRRCSGLDGVSTANEISADVRPGVNETDMSPSRPRCTGVWYGDVMSRVIVGGVDGRSSIMMAGISGWPKCCIRACSR